MTMTNLPYGGAVERVGDLDVVPIFDGYSREDPTHMFITHADAQYERGHRREDWDELQEFLDADGMVEHGLGGFLVQTGNHVVLIDTGVGRQQIGPYGPYDRVIKGGELPAHLAALGVDPAEITDVVLTHLHPDHYGWAAEDDASLFANATFRCHQLDWDYYVTNADDSFGGYFSSQLAGIAGRLECWDSDGPLLPGIDTQHAPGHTPGSTILVLSSGDARAVVLGDVAHCPVELVESDWASLGDVDKALARRTKDALARELEGTGIPVTGPHFPGMRFGRLLPGSGRRQWVV
jgi:glyoxylase-like metal-dependent hydrolase (beta-lactamase superfamily II)